ncbi:DUF4124 domain-containing protein [Rhodoferax sp.]|uniref:DUF4124 domain-containing protein n=1 Tax=Rhodoferax sp. TaxID=50421 RepID=UPI00274AC26D|nr:DUF4124 domain-containing protein [Rhodoferax sp.]
MHHLRYFVVALMVALLSPDGMAQLYKCKDGRGEMAYSDMPCERSGKLGEPRRASVPTKVTVGDGKLTQSAVAKVIEHAAALVVRSDYQGQCALAAPDLSFTATDNSSAAPVIVSGGRAEFCALQRDAARAMAASNLRAGPKLDKMAISLNADSTQATAKYDIVTTISQQGRAVMVQRCAREDVLAVYGRRILYARANASCRSAEI